jgi:monovalent cation/hydrogen antiporter
VSGFEVLALLAGSLTVAAVARRLGWSAPLLLVAVGLVVSFVPGVPALVLDPHIVLALILPPLLYSAALDSSYLGFRANVRPIALHAVALVLVTTVVVGVVAHLVLPGLPLSSAMVLGAVVAPTDAVAAVAIGRRLGLPRRVITVLSGESMVNDGTALTVYKVAVAAVVGAGVSWLGGLGEFALGMVGGAAVGLAAAVAVHAVRQRLADAVLECALGLLVPFGTYLAAEQIGASGVLAVVVAGLYLGHNAPRAGYAVRLQETAVWRALDVLLESLVFALIGLSVRTVAMGVGGAGWAGSSLLVAAAAVLAATILLRIGWVFLAAYVPRWASPKLRARDPVPWQVPMLIGWSGMRGVVTIAAVVALPAATGAGTPFPGRDAIVLLAFVVTVGTLLIHGLSLPWMIRTLRPGGGEAQRDALAEAEVQHRAARTALDRLDAEISAQTPPEHVVRRLQAIAELRGNAAWERLGRQELESPAATFRRLRRTMLSAEREVFVAARDAGRIDDEVLRTVLRELDLEEAALSRE